MPQNHQDEAFPRRLSHDCSFGWHLTNIHNQYYALPNNKYRSSNTESPSPALSVRYPFTLIVPLYPIAVSDKVSVLYNGLGTHIQLVPPNQLVVYMKTLSSGSFLYPACITCVKLSLLAFYKRLFPIKPMVLAVNIVGAMVLLWCFGVCLIGAVTCIPFRKLWEPTIPGGCIDLAKFYYGLQIPNIVTDAVILVMPLRVVWDLQMKRVQKVLLTGIFMLGFLYASSPSLFNFHTPFRFPYYMLTMVYCAAP